MHLHILGIGGTFMGSLAMLATRLGMQVTGQDNALYPPMSHQLSKHQISVSLGFGVHATLQNADLVLVGNVMKRGIPAVEALLDMRKPFYSGPQFLSEYVLTNKHVLVVSGTHGKTTTASMLAWILEYAGMKPGFLIGGVPENFAMSARLGDSQYFVVEGDEYDTAFFDKRSKFLHYQPQTLIMNNIEFDHADIFPNLAAIQTQFHHLLRILPRLGCLIYPSHDANVAAVMRQGCWSQTESFGVESADWTLEAHPQACPMPGQHNKLNALAAMAAAHQVGVLPEQARDALQHFKGIKRRLERVACHDDMAFYSDFAHHPTAVSATMAAMVELSQGKRIVVILDFASNTMKAGVHQQGWRERLAAADVVYFVAPDTLQWDIEAMWASVGKPGGVFVDPIAWGEAYDQAKQACDQVVLMSNGAWIKPYTEFVQKLCAEQTAAVG